MNISESSNTMITYQYDTDNDVFPDDIQLMIKLIQAYEMLEKYQGFIIPEVDANDWPAQSVKT